MSTHEDFNDITLALLYSCNRLELIYWGAEALARAAPAFVILI